MKNSDLQYDAKYPMILPGKHPVTELIIRHYRHLNGHVGSYQVLAEIRQRFWIVKAVLDRGKCHVRRCYNAKFGRASD